MGAPLSRLWRGRVPRPPKEQGCRPETYATWFRQEISPQPTFTCTGPGGWPILVQITFCKGWAGGPGMGEGYGDEC
jgi:hypothetical protein